MAGRPRPSRDPPQFTRQHHLMAAVLGGFEKGVSRARRIPPHLALGVLELQFTLCAEQRITYLEGVEILEPGGQLGVEQQAVRSVDQGERS